LISDIMAYSILIIYLLIRGEGQKSTNRSRLIYVGSTVELRI
jgi:hypothetical protein